MFFVNKDKEININAAELEDFTLNGKHQFLVPNINVDIDNDGALMVQVGEEIRKVVAGDVSIRPKK